LQLECAVYVAQLRRPVDGMTENGRTLDATREVCAAIRALVLPTNPTSSRAVATDIPG